MNRNVQWLDVPFPFSETGNIITAWNENTSVNSWVTNSTVIQNRPIRWRTTESVLINPRALACRGNHERLRRICVELRKAIERELHTRILQDVRDEVILMTPMISGLKILTPTYNFRTLSTMLVSAIGSLIVSTCLLE